MFGSLFHLLTYRLQCNFRGGGGRGANLANYITLSVRGITEAKE
jgi:hypothetical protein